MSELVTILKVKLLNGCIGLSKIVKKKNLFSLKALQRNEILLFVVFSALYESLL